MHQKEKDRSKNRLCKRASSARYKLRSSHVPNLIHVSNTTEERRLNQLRGIVLGAVDPVIWSEKSFKQAWPVSSLNA